MNETSAAGPTLDALLDRIEKAEDRLGVLEAALWWTLSIGPCLLLLVMIVTSRALQAT